MSQNIFININIDREKKDFRQRFPVNRCIITIMIELECLFGIFRRGKERKKANKKERERERVRGIERSKADNNGVSF